MKKHVLLAFALTLGMSSWSYAYTYVECGKSVNDDFEVSEFELALSSTEDKYSGPVGGTWNLKLGSSEAEWLKKDRNITAKSIELPDGSENIEITVKVGRSVGGPVGTMYKVVDFWSDSPVLEKYIIGGFVGKALVETFPCYSSHD